jgi:hypothetical protein
MPSLDLPFSTFRDLHAQGFEVQVNCLRWHHRVMVDINAPTLARSPVRRIALPLPAYTVRWRDMRRARHAVDRQGPAVGPDPGRAGTPIAGSAMKRRPFSVLGLRMRPPPGMPIGIDAAAMAPSSAVARSPISSAITAFRPIVSIRCRSMSHPGIDISTIQARGIFAVQAVAIRSSCNYTTGSGIRSPSDSESGVMVIEGLQVIPAVCAFFASDSWTIESQLQQPKS